MNRLSIIAAFFALLFLAGHSALAQSGYDLFQKGLVKERTEGNLEEAIRLYKQIVEDFTDDHALAAKALIQMGGCYEKLGKAEAQKAYQRVIEEYPGQKQEVAIAKERIAEISKVLKSVAQQPTFRKIKIASKPQNGVLSPDGNKLAFISEGAVWVVPLHGKVEPDIAGEPVRLAEVPGIWDTGNLMAWSADGEWIAVNAWPDEDEVHVIPAAGGEPRVVQMPKRGGHSWSYRLSLSPDGQMLAFSALELGTHQEFPESIDRYIYTIPTAGGEPKQVSSRWARLPSFSPDGKFIAYVGYRKREDWPENTKASPYNGDLWVVPSAGGTPVRLATVDGRLRGPVWSPDGKYIAAHHEPGGTNDSKEIWVFPLSPEAFIAGEPEKIALPRSSMDMLAGWTPEGQLGVFLESEEHWAGYTVPASGGKAMQITPESIVPYYPRWSPDGNRIYFRGVYKEEKNVKVETLYVSAAGGDPVEVAMQSERRLLVRVPGGGHNVSPDGKKIVFSASQMPYDPKEGADVWTISLDGGLPVRLTNDASFEGYPCWSPDGEQIAFIDSHTKSDGESSNAIYIVPAEGGQIRQISSESDSVGSGAIAFSPDGERIAFFSDGSIKAIPVEGGEPKMLVGEVKSGRHNQLAYCPDGSKIAHNAAGKIWITPLNGGESEELRTGLPEGAKLSEFGWSPDGEKIAFIASIGGEKELWLIDNFLPEIEPKGKVVRQVCEASEWWKGCSISPLGRFFAFSDRKNGYGEVSIYDLSSGTIRRLTNEANQTEGAYECVVSPNEEQIAYCWIKNSDGSQELRLVGTDGSRPRTLYRDKDGLPITPFDWSPDGKEILVFHKGIAMVSVDDGSVRFLKKISHQLIGKVNMHISPDGCYIAYDLLQKGDITHRDIYILSTDGRYDAPLIEKSSKDVLLDWYPDGKSLLFRSNRTGSWDAWRIRVKDGKPDGTAELVKKDFGSIGSLGFTRDGSFYFMSFMGGMDICTAKIDLSKGKIVDGPENPIERGVGRNVSAAWSPDGKYLAYIAAGSIHIRSEETGKEKEISPQPGFYGIEWFPDGLSLKVYGEDTEGNRGLFRVDTETGAVETLLMQTPEVHLHRCCLGPKGKNIYYKSYRDSENLSSIFAYDIQSRQKKKIWHGEEKLEGPVPSPDGQWLAMEIYQAGGSSSHLAVMPINGGEIRELAESSSGGEFV